MKIISKFKDYYDYMAGIWGIDEKIIYNRQPFTLNYKGEKLPASPPRIEYPILNDRYHPTYVYLKYFAVCGVAYVFVPFDNKIYYGTEIKELFDNHSIKNIEDLKYNYSNYVEYNGISWRGEDSTIHNKPTKLNDIHNCPIIQADIDGNVNYLNPKLSEFDFGRIIDPQTLYLGLSNWLSRETPIINNMSNKEKILSHGFDLKTSFRGK